MKRKLRRQARQTSQTRFESRPATKAPVLPAPAVAKEWSFDQPLEADKIDAEKGIIYGVSVITSGITARGHDLEVDAKTLTQMLECAQRKGKVPTKWNHKTGADAINGNLRNFSIVGDRLRADWHLLKTHPQFAHALELATEMPDGVGLSASFTGDPEKKNGKSFARCDDLVSTDLVANPAANPTGLFEAVVDKAFSGMAEPDPNSDPVLAELQKLNGRFDSIEDRFGAIEEFNDELRDALDDEGGEEIDDEEDFDDEEGDIEGEDAYDDGYGDDGEGDFAGVGAGDGGGSAEFRALTKRLNHLEAVRQREIELEAKEVEEHNFAVLESKILHLKELCENLREENKVLVEFRDKVRANRALSVSDSGEVHRFSATGNVTDYERRVTELEAGGKKRTEAIRQAMDEGSLYQRHLESIGSVQTL